MLPRQSYTLRMAVPVGVVLLYLSSVGAVRLFSGDDYLKLRPVVKASRFVQHT